MRLTDTAIQLALNAGAYVRRPGWVEKAFCYHVDGDVIECGYKHGERFNACGLETDRYSLDVDDLFANDWEVI